jgi:hypothetical protein
VEPDAIRVGDFERDAADCRSPAPLSRGQARFRDAGIARCVRIATFGSSHGVMLHADGPAAGLQPCSVPPLLSRRNPRVTGCRKRTENPRVGGSIPPPGTNRFKHSGALGCFFHVAAVATRPEHFQRFPTAATCYTRHGCDIETKKARPKAASARPVTCAPALQKRPPCPGPRRHRHGFRPKRSLIENWLTLG